MSARRFINQFAAHPEMVKGLRADHPALSGARTIFPSTVVEAGNAPRLLVSGKEQRKIGERVVKGRWGGMPIFCLTLEERATCPASCKVWAQCYGNGMPYSRRHKHGPGLEARLADELQEKQDRHPEGFVVRLHILGDFYDAAYVFLWHRWIVQFPALRIYGYTAHDPYGSLIGRAIDEFNILYPDRAAIRFSGAEARGNGIPVARTLFYRPDSHRIAEGIVCPVESGATACCATCGLCWQSKEPIVFVAHGPTFKRRPEAVFPSGDAAE